MKIKKCFIFIILLVLATGFVGFALIDHSTASVCPFSIIEGRGGSCLSAEDDIVQAVSHLSSLKIFTFAFAVVVMAVAAFGFSAFLKTVRSIQYFYFTRKLSELRVTIPYIHIFHDIPTIRTMLRWIASHNKLDIDVVSTRAKYVMS